MGWVRVVGDLWTAGRCCRLGVSAEIRIVSRIRLSFGLCDGVRGIEGFLFGVQPALGMGSSMTRSVTSTSFNVGFVPGLTGRTNVLNAA